MSCHVIICDVNVNRTYVDLKLSNMLSLTYQPSEKSSWLSPVSSISKVISKLIALPEFCVLEVLCSCAIDTEDSVTDLKSITPVWWGEGGEGAEEE